MEQNTLNGVILRIWTTFLKTLQRDVRKPIIIHLNSIKINFYYFSIAPELNDIITVSLIDEDELDDIKKENEAYNSMHVVDETIENNEEEPIELPPIGKTSKQYFNTFFV